MTGLQNENYHDRPMSRYMAQLSANSRRAFDPDFNEDEGDLSSFGRAEVALGGGSDRGAGHLRLMDHEVCTYLLSFCHPTESILFTLAP